MIELIFLQFSESIGGSCRVSQNAREHNLQPRDLPPLATHHSAHSRWNRWEHTRLPEVEKPTTGPTNSGVKQKAHSECSVASVSSRDLLRCSGCGVGGMSKRSAPFSNIGGGGGTSLLRYLRSRSSGGTISIRLTGSSMLFNFF